MEKHIKILGIIFVICGVLGVLLSLAIMVFVGPFASSKIAEENPVFTTFIIGFIVEVAGFVAMLVSIIKGAAGICLLKRYSWGWILALLASVLSLFSFPVGTAIGIYGIWVLFNDEVKEIFDNIESAEMEESTG